MYNNLADFNTFTKRNNDPFRCTVPPSCLFPPVPSPLAPNIGLFASIERRVF